MKILLFSLSFGPESASGQCSRRMADALADLGHEVVVISGATGQVDWDKGRHIRCSRFPYRPSQLLFKISNLVQYDVLFLGWRIRAYFAAKKLLSGWTPDVVYGRGSPSAPLEIATKISTQYNIPLVLHFSDPIPSPESWDPNIKYRKRSIALISRISQKSDLLSFGNRAMLEYQEKVLDMDLSGKSFIAPDPMPNVEMYNTNKPVGNDINLVYFGRICGNRHPQNLFRAIDMINDEGISCKLSVYGDDTFVHNHSENVLFLGRTNDAKSALNSASIFVDLDGDDEEPVFISSKIKDYLCFSRPILSITPNNSPTRYLFDGVKSIHIAHNDTEEILEGLKILINGKYSTSDYEKRFMLASQFNPVNIAKQFEREIGKLIN